MTRKPDLFSEWSNLNYVISAWRSRFDVLRERLPLCTTRQEAEELIASEGYGQRYPLLPEWLV